MIFFDRHKIKFGLIHKTKVDRNTWMFDKEHVELKNLKSLKRKNEYTGIRQLRNNLIPKNEIYYNSSGKPLLDLDNRYISVSHSAQSICLGLSDKPIGIDIEKIDQRILKVRSKYVNDEEKKLYEYDSLEELTILWTIKECLYKLHNIKGLSFKNDLNVISRNKNEHFFEVKGDKGIHKHLLRHEKIDNEILTYNIT